MKELGAKKTNPRMRALHEGIRRGATREMYRSEWYRTQTFIERGGRDRDGKEIKNPFAYTVIAVRDAQVERTKATSA